ncbi:MAG: asparagine synthase B [Thermoleophilaceae bacterium]
MCGIAAQYGGTDHGVVARMLERLEHRGPDDGGSIELEEAWLGHRRLSIVDVSGGRQPLSTRDGSLWLVGNGEVYNHEAIRGRLNGTDFRTSSDNEVALALVARQGPAALAELNGMFAFVIAGEDERFIAARDPVGIKPLYWARRDDEVLFASEITAFDVDWQADVEAFPPGHYWTPASGLVRFASAVPPAVRHASPGLGRRDQAIPPELLEETREVLVSSVERHMMGDVPVGVFLSGGLDSSLVAAIAQRYLSERGQQLKTFAVGLADSPDVIAAAIVAEHLGTEHHASVYTAEQATAVLPEVIATIESFDPSLVRSAVPNFLLARFTAEHVKVVLTGEGADELYAGYEYMREFDDPIELHDELVRTVEGLHNLNLQRCDRVTMAHGLEARVPFLDQEVIESALRVHPELKMCSAERSDKHLLRLAFDGWLPPDLLWRGKAQFGDGSGAASVLTEPFTDSVSEQDFERERKSVSPTLRTREELAYFRIFRAHLGAVRPERTLGRFATA